MKHIFIFIFSFVLIFLSGCVSKEIHIYDDSQINEFDEILTNVGNGKTKAYDLRPTTSCYEGRIPKFTCVRTSNTNGELITLDKICENLRLLLGDKHNYMIILMDADGQDSKYLAEKLFSEGYYNIHYFKNGYNKYVEQKGDSFVPEVGECNIC